MALPLGRFQEAAQARIIWDATPPHGTTLKDMLDPGYWAHVAHKLRPWDRVEVRAEDNSWAAELEVVPVSAKIEKGAVLRVRHYWDHAGQAVVDLKAEDQYEVSFAPAPGHRWRVLRKADKAVLAKGFESREQAIVAMNAMPRALAA